MKIIRDHRSVSKECAIESARMSEACELRTYEREEVHYVGFYGKNIALVVHHKLKASAFVEG